MNIVPITLDFCDLEKVEKLAKEAFPPEEYLAPAALIEMAQSKALDFWALYDKECFVGFMVIKIYKKLSYLFVLAVDPLHRAEGYGSQALKLIKEIYPDKQQVVDFEMVDDSAQNKEQRKKRRFFYMRNGYQETGKFLSYGGVVYEIFCTGDDFDFESFQDMMRGLPMEGFTPQFFEKKPVYSKRRAYYN